MCRRCHSPANECRPAFSYLHYVAQAESNRATAGDIGSRVEGCCGRNIAWAGAIVIHLPRFGLGCAPLGNLFSEVSDGDALETVDAAWDAGIRLFDTAPLYGNGLSELRLGEALAKHPRAEYVLASKVGKLLRPVEGVAPDSVYAGTTWLMPVPDFSRDGVLRSIEESLIRLGADRLDIVHVHDPDDHEHEALDGAFGGIDRPT